MSELATYRQRKRAGLVRPKPRRLDIDKARMIRRRYFARQATQMQLALEHDVSQATIARVVANMVFMERR